MSKWLNGWTTFVVENLDLSHSQWCCKLCQTTKHSQFTVTSYTLQLIIKSNTNLEQVLNVNRASFMSRKISLCLCFSFAQQTVLLFKPTVTSVQWKDQQILNDIKWNGKKIYNINGMKWVYKSKMQPLLKVGTRTQISGA